MAGLGKKKLFEEAAGRCSSLVLPASTRDLKYNRRAGPTSVRWIRLLMWSSQLLGKHYLPVLREVDFNMAQEVQVNSLSYSCQNLRENEQSHRSLACLCYLGSDLLFIFEG